MGKKRGGGAPSGAKRAKPARKSAEKSVGVSKAGGNWEAMKGGGKARKRARPYGEEPKRMIDVIEEAHATTMSKAEEQAKAEEAGDCGGAEEEAAAKEGRGLPAPNCRFPEGVPADRSGLPWRVLPPVDDKGNIHTSDILALDCEMVGVGPKDESVLAQVCVVDVLGRIVYLSFCKTIEDVKDYRTWVSGVRPEHLKRAPTFKEVQREVADLIRGRVVVGHAIHNDFKALLLHHPRQQTRDTASYRPFCWQKQPGGKLRPRRLRDLVQEHLGMQIQAGEHSPAEDAIGALDLYKKYRKPWERWLRTGQRPEGQPQGARKRFKRWRKGPKAKSDEAVKQAGATFFGGGE